jgi:hypothetical protein
MSELTFTSMQGTIQYLEQLESKVRLLEEHNTRLQDKARKAKPSFLSDSPDSATSDLPETQVPLAVKESLESLKPQNLLHCSDAVSSDSGSATTEADEAASTAELLIHLSTSPELRPVVF